MRMYRVKITHHIDDILEVIRNKGQFPYPTRDFACRARAEIYAFSAALKTGNQVNIEIRDPNQYASLREKLAHIMGAEQ